MTQERYQEAAECLEQWFGNPAVSSYAHLAIETLHKLASGWVLVPGEPVAWRWRDTVDGQCGDWRNLPANLPSPEKGEDGFVVEYAYAAAPKP